MKLEDIVHSTLFGLVVGFLLYIVECLAICNYFYLQINNKNYLVQYYLIFQSIIIAIAHYKLFYKDIK